MLTFLVTILHFVVNIVIFKNLWSNGSKTLDPRIFYFISNTSFLTILDFNVFDIEIVVYYASFEMLQTEVMLLSSNSLLFNSKILILWVSLIIVQYNTILTKKVHNYFEVMNNYIIALALHARRNILMSFWSNSCQPTLLQMMLLLSWIHIWLILFLVHSWTPTLYIKQGVSDLHLPQFSSCNNVSLQFSSVKTSRQQVWVR